MISYANGKYIETEKLSLPVASDTIGTIRGYRIFTACKTVGSKVFHLEDHIERLFLSSISIYMDLPHSREELKNIVKDLVGRNHTEFNQELLLEIIYSGGQAALNGVAPAGPANLYIFVLPLKLPPSSWYSQGISLATYRYQRQFAEVKLLNYVGAVIAHKTVVKDKNADEALFITPDNRRIVLEGTTFNFFIVRNGIIWTHPLNGNILSGITRKIVIDLAGKIGLQVREDLFTYNDIKSADQAFITSSTRNIVPVVRVDDTVIGSGAPGAISKTLAEIFSEYEKGYGEI